VWSFLPTSPSRAVSRDSMAMWILPGPGRIGTPGLDLPANLGQPRHDLLPFRHGDDALLSEHAGVGDGTGDILAVETPVKSSGMW